MSVLLETRIRRRPKLKLGPEVNGIVMTHQEFDDATSFTEGYRYELIRGVLIVSPPILAEERGPNQLLGHRLLTYQETHPQGSVIDLTLPEEQILVRLDRRRADRAIWIGLGRMPDLNVDIPAIVIEFVSAAKSDAIRDYETKRSEYLSIPSIQEYWIIDRFLREMLVVRRTPTGLEDVLIVAGAIYRTPRLPGFELAVTELFQVAENLTKSRSPKSKRAKKKS